MHKHGRSHQKTIANKLTCALPSIISTAIKELSNSKLNITIDTSNSTKSTIKGNTSEQDATKHDDNSNSTSDDNTNPMVSLSKTLKDPAKNAQSESESDKENEVEQFAQNKKKSETLTKAVLIQRCKSV
eukprot:14957444-Ditylum_brightwellii.AAC.1